MRLPTLTAKAFAVTSSFEDDRLPLLVIGHGLRSAPTLQIVEAASELCRILWLIDGRIPENALSGRLLRKVGTVLDTGGLSPAQTAASLKQHSPDGVVTYRDEDIVPLAEIAAELGLEFHTPEVARRLVDKLLQREAFRRPACPPRAAGKSRPTATKPLSRPLPPS